MADDWSTVQSEMELAFRNGQVAAASDEQLQRWLQNLSTGHVANEMVRHREIIRGITINHIQMARTIRQIEETMRKLNAGNERTQRLIIRLTWVAVAVGVVQAIAGIIALAR